MEQLISMDRIMGFFDTPMLINMAMQWVNTAIMCGILSYFLYQPVKKFMKTRADRIKNQLDTAETNLKSSQDLKADYERKLKEIDKERSEILDKARAQALAKSEQIVAEAKHEAQNLKNRAALDIQREIENAKDEMRKQMIEISSLVASRYISTNIDQTTQSRLLDEVIADLGDTTWLS